MATGLIQDRRVQRLNDRTIRTGCYVLYWMQQSQRAEYNHALEYAIQQANRLGRPLLVVFGLMDDYPETNLRHYAFMLEGLRETQAALARRGIKLVVRHGHPIEITLRAGDKASLIVCDRGYLRHQKAWRRKIAAEAHCRVVQVESDVVVPVEVVSDKAEYAARTIRPKIHKHLDDYLIELRTTPLERHSLHLEESGLPLDDLNKVLNALDLDREIAPVSRFFQGGTSQARTRLQTFIDKVLDGYDQNRNQPQLDQVSQLSPYLHFGQISPLYLALEVKRADHKPQVQKDAFLEELVLRRELAMNFVHYTEHYDVFRCLPDWALKTLEEHQNDQREYLYTRRQLENAATHDAYWNAAMKEMKHTGYMHNYMRMYWGKKILEWCQTPEYAYRTALALNNKYFLDGRDPISYANVAWLFGLHDRPWKERSVFGKIRYLSASGLERKCDIRGYVKKVEQRIQS